MKATWEEIKNQIRTALPKNSFTLWIDPLTFLEKKDKTLVLGCPNKFSRNWVMENYLHLIKDKLYQEGADNLELVLKVDSRKKQPSTQPAPLHEQMTLPNIPENGKHHRLRLNTEFTFDKFIVGRSNEFAYSASNALANGDQWNYQSLLMLAKTGLGKTHLAHAVGHAVLRQNPQSRVYYITAEDFTNQMISALKTNRIEEFKNRYRRSCDVLLLEEIHFLGGKEKIQLELGYTLDALANDNKRIIFTSSLPPRDIPSMSRELSSRLTSGLVSTIADPDYNTRVKILTKKASQQNLPVSEEIIHLLARRLNRDVRQMESALKCLKAKSELLKVKIDTSLAKEVINCLVSDESSITTGEIRELVARYYKVDPDMLRSKSRKKTCSYPRNIYVYLCRQHTDETLENIAETINRSHSAVLYAAEIVEHRIKTDDKMKHQVEFLSQKLEEMKK